MTSHVRSNNKTEGKREKSRGQEAHAHNTVCGKDAASVKKYKFTSLAKPTQKHTCMHSIIWKEERSNIPLLKVIWSSASWNSLI